MAVTPGLEWWQQQCNRVAEQREQHRVRQFGLRPVTSTPPADTALPGEVWAWQAPTPRGSEDGVGSTSTVRVGFAGDRPHAGHLGLARVAGELAGPEGTILVFDASGDSKQRMVDAFRAALEHFAPRQPQIHVLGESPELRRFQRRAAGTLPLDRLGRIYGFDATTHLATALDVADMLGFFLFTPAEHDTAGVALVDALQAPHSAVLKHGARALAAPAPVLLYRRLFPHLRRAGRRGSMRDASSVMFVDDSEETVRSKFAAAITGGRPSVAEHRAYGGDPVRCSAFATMELLCSPQQAGTALAECRSGQATCSECKVKNADGVVDGMRAITERLSTARAGPSTRVGPAVQQAVPTLYRPPPRECGDLETAIAAHTGTAAEQVVAANGSTEAMDWLFHLHAKPGAQVVATEPAFELYRDLAQRHGLDYVPVAWEPATFAPDLPALERAINGDTTLVVVELPHSVSGAAVALDAIIERLVPRLPPDARLLLDLAYADFTDPAPRIDATRLEDHPEVVAFSTLSKAHCLLGARVGYALTATPLAAQLRRQRLPYGLDALATAAAQAALTDEQRVERTVQANRAARERLSRLLDEHGIAYIPTQANFLLMNLGERYQPVVDRLRARNARYRDGHRWDLAGWIQVHLIDLPTIAPVIDAIESTAPGRP